MLQAAMVTLAAVSLDHRCQTSLNEIALAACEFYISGFHRGLSIECATSHQSKYQCHC